MRGLVLGVDLGGGVEEGERTEKTACLVDGAVGVGEQTPIAIADADADDAIWREVCKLPAAVAELGGEAEQRGLEDVALDAGGISVNKTRI